MNAALNNKKYSKQLLNAHLIKEFIDPFSSLCLNSLRAIGRLHPDDLVIKSLVLRTNFYVWPSGLEQFFKKNESYRIINPAYVLELRLYSGKYFFSRLFSRL